MNARQYWKVIRRKWPVMVACALAAGLVMWIVTPAEPPPVERVTSYNATATLLVSAPPSQDGTPQNVSMDRIALYITTGDIPRLVAQEVGYTQDPALLASQLAVSPNPSSMSITLTMSGGDPERLPEIVNAFADQAVAFFATPQPGAGRIELSVLQEATPIPVVASGGFSIPPSRPFRTIMAALLGLLIGFGLALVLHQVDSRLRTRDEVYEALRMPVIAEVPKLSRSQREDKRILVADEPHGVYADGYRTARAAIMHTTSRFLAEDPRLARDEVDGRTAPAARVVLVTSAMAAEGKTTSIANLAATFAETGRSVLVLDADLCSPDLHLRFDVPQGAGISDFLYDPASTRLESLARPTSVAGVRIITAGTQLAHPASLATRMGTLVEEARKVADVILIDAAPILAASDVFDLLPIVDTVLFVVRSGRLTESSAHRVSELLGRFHVPVAGALLLGTPSRRAYGYGYGHGYDSAEDDPAAGRRAHRKLRGEKVSTKSQAAAPREETVDATPAGVHSEAAQPVPTTRSDRHQQADFDPYEGYRPDRDQP